MRKKVEDFTQYEKDEFSKGVVNVDKKALDGYKLQRAKLAKAFSVTQELEELKEEMKEIKSMLSQLINNK